MKCLSVIQPWATLIIALRKPAETRSWQTSYRGPVGIHASQKVDRAAAIEFGYDPAKLVTGAVLGIAELVNCVQFPSPLAPPDKYGDFTEGRFGWIWGKITPLKKPMPMKGMLGLWDCPELDKARQTRLV